MSTISVSPVRTPRKEESNRYIPLSLEGFSSAYLLTHLECAILPELRLFSEAFRAQADSGKFEWTGREREVERLKAVINRGMARLEEPLRHAHETLVKISCFFEEERGHVSHDGQDFYASAEGADPKGKLLDPTLLLSDEDLFRRGLAFFTELGDVVQQIALRIDTLVREEQRTSAPPLAMVSCLERTLGLLAEYLVKFFPRAEDLRSYQPSPTPRQMSLVVRESPLPKWEPVVERESLRHTSYSPQIALLHTNVAERVVPETTTAQAEQLGGVQRRAEPLRMQPRHIHSRVVAVEETLHSSIDGSRADKALTNGDGSSSVCLEDSSLPPVPGEARPRTAAQDSDFVAGQRTATSKLASTTAGRITAVDESDAPQSAPLPKKAARALRASPHSFTARTHPREAQVAVSEPQAGEDFMSQAFAPREKRTEQSLLGPTPVPVVVGELQRLIAGFVSKGYSLNDQGAALLVLRDSLRSERQALMSPENSVNGEQRRLDRDWTIVIRAFRLLLQERLDVPTELVNPLTSSTMICELAESVPTDLATRARISALALNFCKSITRG